MPTVVAVSSSRDPMSVRHPTTDRSPPADEIAATAIADASDALRSAG